MAHALELLCMSLFLASIPSPTNGNIGPFHMYGLIMAAAILVAYEIMKKRWQARGLNPKVPSDVTVIVVIAGIIGARMYHVATSYDQYRGHWIDTLKIWNGGLGIWGAVLGGGIAMAVMAHIKHFSLAIMADCIAPALVLGQAIVRWGNYFNQELFGRPTSLPWGLEISPDKRPLQYIGRTTFHPTFLYESLWCLAVFFALLWIEKHFRLRPGQLFCAYVCLYTFGRFWFENLRIDPAHKIGPLRLNAWVSVVVFIGGLIAFYWLGKRGNPSSDTTREESPITGL